MISGLNFRTALKNALLLNVGMFAAKASARGFGLNSSETDPSSWTWRSYIQAGLGSAGVALLMNSIKPGKGQRVLEGGMAFTLYKVIQNGFVQGNATASKWFGADDDDLELEGYGYGADPNILPLDGYGDEDDEVVLVDGYGDAIPLNEDYRMDGLGAFIRPGMRRRPGFPGRRFGRRPPPFGQRRFGRRPHQLGRRRPSYGRRPPWMPQPPMPRPGGRRFGPPRRRGRFRGEDDEPLGSVLLPVGPLGDDDYGDVMAPPGPLGAEDDVIVETAGYGDERSDMLDAYSAAYQQQ